MTGPRKWPVFPCQRLLLASIPPLAVRVRIVLESQSPPRSGLGVCVCVGGRGAGQVAQVFTRCPNQAPPPLSSHTEAGRWLGPPRAHPQVPLLQAH